MEVKPAGIPGSVHVVVEQEIVGAVAVGDQAQVAALETGVELEEIAVF